MPSLVPTLIRRRPRPLDLVCGLAVGLLVAHPNPAGAQVVAPVTFRVTWSNATQFATCFRETSIDLTTEPGHVLLAPSVALVHGVGNHIGRLTVASNQVACKIFRLDKAAAEHATLYVSGSVAKARVNGAEVACRYIEGIGWSAAEFAGTRLHEGDNLVEFDTGTTLAYDTDQVPARFSQLGGADGRPSLPAPGEFLVHLRLDQHPDHGTITSDVVDLANPGGVDQISPAIRVTRVVVGSYAVTPEWTYVLLEARSGATVWPDEHWTGWVPGMQVRPDRFVQWRATLRTRDPGVTPVLKGVSVKAVVVTLADPVQQGLRVTSFQNQRIVRGSYPFTFQRPSAKLARLRSQWKLDAVIAAGQTELDQFLLLRNWVRKQWPHNEGNCTRPWDAINILSAPPGDHGMCVHYGVTMTQCALALGFNARQALLQNHYVADLWSNEAGKWILMDVEAVQSEGWDRYGTAVYWDRERNVPMNVVDLHREAWVRNRPENILQKLAMTDPAGVHQTYERTYGQKEYGNFYRVAQFTRNNYLDQLEPWERQHGVDYYHSDEYLWWEDTATPLFPQFTRHTNRDGDFLWTVNQAALTLTATESADRLGVMLDTVTPNLKGFLYRFDGQTWQLLPGTGADPHSRRASLNWTLRPGENTLEVKPRNAFDRDGIVSRVTVVR